METQPSSCSENAMHRGNASPEARQAPDPERQATILIVDDEASVLAMCRRCLDGAGYRLLVAPDGADALRILAGEPVDVLLSDYFMPGMSGIELARQVRERYPETVRILYTGIADMHIAEQALNEGEVFRFLFKPFDPSQLRSAVDQAFEHHRMREENRWYREEMEQRVEVQARELLGSKYFLESLIDTVPAGVLAMNEDNVVTLVNQTVQRTFGLGSEEPVGRTAGELGIPCSQVVSCPVRSSTDRAPSSRMLEVRDCGGKLRSLFWSCAALQDKKGPSGGCVASFIDVTDKKMLEATVFQGKQEIEVMFDSITEPMFMVDTGLVVLRANRAAARLAGKDFPGVLGHRCQELFSASTTGCSQCPMGDVFRTGKPAQMEFSSETGRIYKTYFYPFHREGTAEAAVVRYQDVTAEKELEQQLLQSEKMSAIGQLAAGIAHEINNPVGFILSNLNRLGEYAAELAQLGAKQKSLNDTVADGKKDPAAAWVEYRKVCGESDLSFLLEDLGEIVNECQDGAERIRKIVQDLKSFSHPGGKDWEYAGINRGIESTLNVVWNELKYNCEVVREYGDIPDILCLPQQLNQVFMNLLVNAAHAIPEQGTVTVKTWAKEDTVFASISDSGVGMSEEIRSRVFEPFFTTKEQGKGTGLGLHLALSIIDRHGGRIDLESSPGHGSTFTVVLPVVPPEIPGEQVAGDE